jgi:hypothetical protein
VEAKALSVSRRSATMPWQINQSSARSLKAVKTHSLAEARMSS